MSSSKALALTELERDLPTSRADVDTLRHLHRARASEPFKALQALVDALPAAARRPRRTTAAGRPEFTL